MGKVRNVCASTRRHFPLEWGRQGPSGAVKRRRAHSGPLGDRTGEARDLQTAEMMGRAGEGREPAF